MIGVKNLFTLTTQSPEETMALGEKLGQLLRPSEVITLTGDLGAGKTHFSKGVGQGLGVADHITSPTFTIINEYKGRLPFYHIDAYRIADSDEVFDLGIEEYLFGQGVTLIEWPQVLKEVLPEQILAIEITKDAKREDMRYLNFYPIGSRYEDLVRELKEKC